MLNFFPAGGQVYNLNASIGSTDTTITLSSFTEPVSNTPYTMAYFNSSIMFGTIGPRTTSSEFISFTGITQNLNGTATLTGVVRGLQKAYPYTTSATFKLPHSGQSAFILSDSPQVFDQYAALSNANEFTGVNTFDVSPQVPTPTNPNDAADKAYVDGIAISGSPDMSTTSKGVARASTSPNVTLGNPTITIASPAVITLNSHGLTLNDTVQFTTTGALPTGISASTTYYVISAGLTTNAFEISATLGGTAINTSGTQSGTHTLIKTTPVALLQNDSRVPTANEVLALVGNNIDIPIGAGNKVVTQTGLQHNAEKYAADTSGSSTAYVVTLVPVPTSLTVGMIVYAKIVNANTTTTPTINVNSLGAKTIVKSTNTALATGDIGANSLNTFIYDGTNMVLQNPVANVPTPSSFGINVVRTVANFDAAGRYSLSATSNSANPSITTNGLQLNNAGSGVGSSSFQWNIIGSASSSDTLYTIGAKFGTRFSAPSALSTNVGNMYFGLGALTVTSNVAVFTGDHIGFKVVISAGVATLFGTIGQGGAEVATSALTTLAINDSVDAFFAINSGSVDFYYRKNGGTFTGPTTLTTTLPTSSSLVAMGFAGVGTFAANFTSPVQSMNYER